MTAETIHLEAAGHDIGRRHAAVLHGHDEPRQLLRSRLDALLSGRGSIVVVHGRAGMGKTALLTEIMTLGAQRGVRVLHGTCDVLTHPIPLAPILSALTESTEPFLNRDELMTLTSSPAHYFWFAQTLREALERTALRHPVLIALDALQWADAATLFTLTHLVEKLAGHRLMWIVAARAEAASPLVSAALDLLVRNGAARTEAEPLTLRSVAEIIRDLLGVDPGPELPAALAGLETQPLLLIELLHGWREEASLKIVDGTAQLVSACLPARVRELIDGQLRRLSPSARKCVQLGAALGQRFTAAELAALAGHSPVAMTATIEEVIAAGLLISLDGLLCFRHQLVREAVRTGLPAAQFSALRHKAVTVRLANGAPTADVVELVLETSQRGDNAAVALLDRAATEVGRTAPAMAIRLSRRALELTTPDDPHRPALIIRSAGHLVRAGRIEEARSLIAATAGGISTPAAQVEMLIRIAILALATDPHQSIELSELCQRLPELTPAARAHCLALEVCAWHVLGDTRAAGEAADRLSTHVETSTDPAVRSAARIPMALRAMVDHDWQRSLELARDPVSTHPHANGGLAPRHWIPGAWQALLMVTAIRLDDALNLIDAGIDAARRRGLTPVILAWTTTRARALLDAGRLTEARSAADHVLDLSADLNTPSGYLTDIAQYVIGSAGLHLGRPADLDRSRVAATHLRKAKLPVSRQLGAWLTIRLTAVDDKTDLNGMSGSAMLPVIYPGSHADAVRLTRLLAEAGDRHRAESIASRLSELAEDHPDFPYLRASATHARALLRADPELAAAAAALHHDDPRPLVKASAYEDAGRLLPFAEREQAVAWLTEALSLYSAAGAEYDAGRVRALLRERGVRRTSARGGPPADSWPELTPSELRVAQLVATGSTNQVIAERLHLSPHTINTHLRHIFAKLQVRSRVELTRIVTERRRQTRR